MTEWVSPVDGHRHFGDAGRAECAVCCLEAERDAFRDHAIPEAAAIMNDMSRRAAELTAERNRLRDALREVYSHLGPPQPPGYEIGEEGVPALVQKAMAERDRLRSLVDAYRDEMAHIASAVAGDGTGTAQGNDILGIVRTLVADCERLTAANCHYHSTACFHELHDRCRRVCKFCSDPCQCECHPSDARGEGT